MSKVTVPMAALLIAAASGASIHALRVGRAEPDDPIAATVNGKPIYEEDLGQALPRDVYGATLDRIKKERLWRMVNALRLREYLRANKVAVSDSAVACALEQARQKPPSPGCACCRYATLEDFLTQKHYTLDEYRDELRNNLGLKRLLENLWSETYPDAAARAALVLRSRPGVERDAGGQKLSEEQALAVAKDSFLQHAQSEIWAEIWRSSKIEYHARWKEGGIH